jgi:predicted NBD/HSP70 family sugar kinase
MRDHQVARTVVQDFVSLRDLPISGPLPEQLRKFTIESLRAKRVRHFDAHESLSGLRASDGEMIIAADIGGDKLSASYFVVRDGTVERAKDLLSCQADGGAGYLAALVELSERASREGVPVGISFAGPVDGTRLVAAPNLPALLAEFKDAYGSDFGRLFPVVQVANDAVAGLMAGAVEAARRYPDVCDVIYLINGSGLGGAVLTGSAIYAAEPGHVPVADGLNPFGQRRPCGLGGASYACVEVVAASKAGVEDIWRQRTPRRLSGHEISARYQAGDRLARDLYDNSAQITAHVIRGIADAFGLASDPGRLVVVGHGGIFYVPGYGDRIMDILGEWLGASPRFLFTREFSPNTCLEGAAVAAINGDPRTGSAPL